MPHPAAVSRAHGALAAVPDPQPAPSRFGPAFAVIALFIAALASVVAVQVVLHGQRAGQPTSTQSFIDLARPLPDFVSRPLGNPTSGRAEADATVFPAELGDPLYGGFADTDPDQVGFALLDPPTVTGRTDFDGGVRYTTADVDIVHDHVTAQLREQLVVHRHQGVRTWSWRLAGDGVRTGLPRLDASGDIVLANGGRILAPRIYDATGTVIPISGLAWQLRGLDFSLTVDDANLALPYVIDPDGAVPTIAINRLQSASPCVYIDTPTSAYIRSIGCAGSLDVRAIAFDTVDQPTTGPNDPQTPVGLGSGTSSGTYGVAWDNAPNTFQTNGIANFSPSTIQYKAGYGQGLKVRCWPNDSFSDVPTPGGNAIDTRLDYDAAQLGTAAGMRNLNTTAGGQPPRAAAPGAGDLSCRWT
ncbi:MAG: hypothetical protein JWM86_2636, partial [Thermoleophilia bacterium]|nr:hypothetical protein [Thermoleophilia bacterium]